MPDSSDNRLVTYCISTFSCIRNSCSLIFGWKAIRSQKENDYKRWYWFSLLASLFTIGIYFTGPQTATYIKDTLTHYPQELIENHALWGRFSFIGNIFGGILALMAILNYAQEEKPHKSIPWILIGIILVNVLILSYTAHLGGMIRRPDLML